MPGVPKVLWLLVLGAVLLGESAGTAAIKATIDTDGHQTTPALSATQVSALGAL